MLQAHMHNFCWWDACTVRIAYKVHTSFIINGSRKNNIEITARNLSYLHTFGTIILSESNISWWNSKEQQKNLPNFSFNVHHMPATWHPGAESWGVFHKAQRRFIKCWKPFVPIPYSSKYAQLSTKISDRHSIYERQPKFDFDRVGKHANAKARCIIW